VAPVYLQQLVNHLLVALNELDQQTNKLSLKGQTPTTATDAFLSSRCRQLWKGLPQHLTVVENTQSGTFKNGLKTWIFNKAFGE
jgi:hypothetical protein